jgi:large subunit ribosomal protein L17
MRHGKSFNHLSRKSAHRKALLSNLASSLIIHKRIRTTTAKAKALRTFVEPIITRSKEDSTHSRRLAFSYLGNKIAVSELFREVSSKIGDRPGGYTRILKLEGRPGDNADMCIIELVDYNENLLAEKGISKAKTTRKRRGKKKPGGEQVVDETNIVAEEAEESLTESIDAGTKSAEEAKGETAQAKVQKAKLKASTDKIKQKKEVPASKSEKDKTTISKKTKKGSEK